MPINLTQGLLTAVILKPRALPTNTLVSAAALSAAMPGLLGLLLPLLLIKNNKEGTPPAGPLPTTTPIIKLEVVPDVVGQTEAKALEQFKATRFAVEVQPALVKGSASGIVLSQEPAGKTLFEEGNTVVLFVQRDDASVGGKGNKTA